MGVGDDGVILDTSSLGVHGPWWRPWLCDGMGLRTRHGFYVLDMDFT